MKTQWRGDETPMVEYRNTKGVAIFVLTNKPSTGFFYLYKILPNGNVEKLGRSKTPTELEKKFSVTEQMKE